MALTAFCAFYELSKVESHIQTMRKAHAAPVSGRVVLTQPGKPQREHFSSPSTFAACAGFIECLHKSLLFIIFRSRAHWHCHCDRIRCPVSLGGDNSGC
jgi:hypothetical protein